MNFLEGGGVIAGSADCPKRRKIFYLSPKAYICLGWVDKLLAGGISGGEISGREISGGGLISDRGWTKAPESIYFWPVSQYLFGVVDKFLAVRISSGAGVGEGGG